MSPSEKKLWRIAAIVTVAAAAIAFLLYIHTWNAYYDTLPSSPDSAAGRIYPDNFHGFARYENRQEYIRLHTLDHLSEALVFLIMAGIAVHEWRHGERNVKQAVLVVRNNSPGGPLKLGFGLSGQSSKRSFSQFGNL